MKRPVVHFEIGCRDIDKTSDFYKSVFDWNFTKRGNSALIDTGEAGGLSGHINQLDPEELQNYVTIYIETDSIQADLALIEAHGGKIVVGPSKLADGKEFAWFKDLAGNIVGLLTPA